MDEKAPLLIDRQPRPAPRICLVSGGLGAYCPGRDLLLQLQHPVH